MKRFPLRSFVLVTFVAGVASFALAPRCSAQQQGGSYSGGGFGNQSAFGSGYGAQGGLSSQGGFGSQSAFGAQSPFGNRGFGNSGMGNNGFGNSPFGGNSAFGNQGGALGGQGAGGLGAGGRRGFVGRDAQDVENLFQNLNGGQVQRGMVSMLENLNELRESRRRWRDREDQKPQVRVRLVPNFDVPRGPSAMEPPALAGRLQATIAARGVEDAGVTITNRLAVIDGVVTSERQAQLIERLASLEPGVSKIENRLRVEPQASAPAAPQASPTLDLNPQ